jgi:hypothetical protein
VSATIHPPTTTLGAAELGVPEAELDPEAAADEEAGLDEEVPLADEPLEPAEDVPLAAGLAVEDPLLVEFPLLEEFAGLLCNVVRGWSRERTLAAPAPHVGAS